TLAVLQSAFALALYDAPRPRRTFAGSDEPATYTSARDPRLLVVDRPVGGSKAAALNLGLDYSYYPYVCCVDGDTLYDGNALRAAFQPVRDDPERVVGVTSRIDVAAEPEARGEAGDAGPRSFLLGFQRLEYLRSFLNSRLAWSRLGFMLCASGAFALWRLDVLEEVGGFSRDFSCDGRSVRRRLRLAAVSPVLRAHLVRERGADERGGLARGLRVQERRPSPPRALPGARPAGDRALPAGAPLVAAQGHGRVPAART